MKKQRIGQRRDIEIAALTLLKSTGLSVLNAAQLAAAVVARVRQAKAGTEETPQDAERRETGLKARCMEAVELGLEAMAAREQTVSLEEAGWASVEARADCSATTRRDLRYFLRKVLKVEGARELPLRAMTTRQCREMLQKAFGHSKSMYIKGRALLHSVFAYGIKQEWCDANPVARIEVPRVQETPKAPLPVADVERLLQTAERAEFRDMKLSLNLMLYSGIRPAEVSRLQAEDFCRREKVVIIRPGKSKTGGGRVVPLRHTKDIRPDEWQIPTNWQKRWQQLRRAAGFTHWVPDVCRHTFASYHAAYYRNLPELQLEMGHRDLNLLRTRYMSPAAKQEAKRFWNG
ncbi:MAG: hypothetical protein E7031_09110 [Akkermansiaceae bacterium]|nr:hypothetical protein [Akkermansiaceae bacterium]